MVALREVLLLLAFTVWWYSIGSPLFKVTSVIVCPSTTVLTTAVLWPSLAETDIELRIVALSACKKAGEHSHTKVKIQKMYM